MHRSAFSYILHDDWDAIKRASWSTKVSLAVKILSYAYGVRVGLNYSSIRLLSVSRASRTGGASTNLKTVINTVDALQVVLY